MKRVLITGKGSYIGTAFKDYIGLWSDDYQVDTIDMIDGSWRKKNFAGYDSVFHVAGVAHIKETKKNADLYYKINRDIAYETALKAKFEGVRQFIYLSSMSVYGLETGVISKETPPKPNSNYGKSKLQAEKLIEQINDTSFRVVVVRPPMVYGEGCKGNYDKLKRLMVKIPIFPEIHNQRSMIHISVLVGVIKRLIDEEMQGIFFPQDDEYVCTTELVSQMVNSCGKKIYTTRLFNPLIKLIKTLQFKSAIKMFGDLVYEKEMSMIKSDSHN